MRKRFLVISILTIAVFCLTVGPALADHSPTFYVEWSKTVASRVTTPPFGNAGTGSPHANYLEGTEKCGSATPCTVHPLAGVKWDTNPSVEASRTPVAGGQYNRQEFETTGMPCADADAAADQRRERCDYCHIITAIGGDQLYGGKTSVPLAASGTRASRTATAAPAATPFTACRTNYGDPALYGTYGTFQGPHQAAKVLKVRAKGAGAASGLQRRYVWQDETIADRFRRSGPSIAASGIAGAAAWAAAQTPHDCVPGAARQPTYHERRSAERPALPERDRRDQRHERPPGHRRVRGAVRRVLHVLPPELRLRL